MTNDEIRTQVDMIRDVYGPFDEENDTDIQLQWLCDELLRALDDLSKTYKTLDLSCRELVDVMNESKAAHAIAEACVEKANHDACPICGADNEFRHFDNCPVLAFEKARE